MTAGSNRPSNSVLIAANELMGVSHLVKLTIVVEGRLIASYKDFRLTQHTGGHHQFTLVLDHDSLGAVEDHHMEQAQKLLGKRILVTFRYRNLTESPERDFIGVITQVGLSRENKNHGNIILSGYSPTILLDGATNMQSFGGDATISLNTIAQEVIKQGLGTQKYQVAVETEFGHVTYSCQYEETHYNYLVRLANEHDEQFYYDGDTLRFGRFPFPEKAIQLTFGRNVDQVDIRMKALHVKPSYYGYNSNRHQQLYTGASDIKHQSSLGQSAYKISQNTFTTHALQIAPLRAHTSKDLDAAQDSAAGSRSVDTFVTSGRCSVPFLYPSCLVEMEMIRPGTKKASYFTRLMIVGVEHHVDKLGNYTGHFEAVGYGTGHLPKASYQQPKAEPQFATIIDNKDTQGRVQVRFDWQSKGEQSDWIRVLSPDAGASELVQKNRGFVFIPEVGDRVMVGFVHGNPDRAYVMGGLFHGGIGAGGYQDNHLKTIQTRSGCMIQINDTENEGSITINDPSGNSWYMDGDGNVTVTAPKNITINAGKDINMVAGENINVNVGKDMSSSIGNDHTITVGKQHLFTSDSYNQNIKVDKSVVIGGRLEETTATTIHKATKGDVLIQSSGVAKILGKIDAKVNKG